MIIQRALAMLHFVGRLPWLWLKLFCRFMVAYWPGLAYVVVAGRAVRVWSGWAWLARLGRAGWRWFLRPMAAVCRVVVRAGRWVWSAAEPYVRDVAGWLVHTAPRLAVRGTGRLIVGYCAAGCLPCAGRSGWRRSGRGGCSCDGCAMSSTGFGGDWISWFPGLR